MFVTANGNDRWECSALGSAPAGLRKAVSVTTCSTTAGQSEMLLKLGGFHWLLRETCTPKPETRKHRGTIGLHLPAGRGACTGRGSTPEAGGHTGSVRTPEAEGRRKRKGAAVSAEGEGGSYWCSACLRGRSCVLRDESVPLVCSALQVGFYNGHSCLP